MMTDINTVREAIELFLMNYFDSIEMSGTVKCEKKGTINYLSIDLTAIKWDEDLEKLNSALSKYLSDWAQKAYSNFDDYVSISSLTIEYLLPEKDGANQNQSKHIKLFHLPSYYFHRRDQNSQKLHLRFIIKLLDLWYNVLLRNTIVTAIPTVILVVVSVIKARCDVAFQERLMKSYDYINIASGIIASFVLGYLITKVIAIRQDKLKYSRAIKTLSNKLTYFRNICYNLARDHNFWTSTKPFFPSYQYANSIKNDITYEEYHYPNYDDDIEYAKFKSFYNEKMSHSVVTLVLQLHMMADDNFLDSGLTYTKFPPNYIYSHEEMKKFAMFHDSNQIWYCCTETKIFPEKFYTSHHVKEIIEDINRIYPKAQVKELTKEKLEEASLDFQYRVIPRLYHLTRVVSSKLSLTIRYFTTTAILLLLFGLIIPTVVYIFIDKTYAFASVFVVVGIIVHILLTLMPILRTENKLDPKEDYL